MNALQINGDSLALGLPPRKVRFRRQTWDWRFKLLLLLVWSVGLVSLLPIIVAPLQRLNRFGVPTPGIVTGLSADSESKIQLDYIYSVNGKSFHGSEPFTSDLIPDAVTGSHVTIYVIPEDPSVHHFGPVSNASMLECTQWYTAAKLAVPPIVLVVIVFESWIRKQRKLLKYGVAVHARINAVEPRTRWLYYIKCACVESAIAGPWEFSVFSWTIKENSVGSSLTVLYDPDHSTDAMRYDRINSVEVFVSKAPWWRFLVRRS